MFSDASIILKSENMLKMQLMYNDFYMPILKVNLKKVKKVYEISQLAWPTTTKKCNCFKIYLLYIFFWIYILSYRDDLHIHMYLVCMESMVFTWWLYHLTFLEPLNVNFSGLYDLMKRILWHLCKMIVHCFLRHFKVKCPVSVKSCSVSSKTDECGNNWLHWLFYIW